LDYQCLLKKDKTSLAAARGLSLGIYPARWVSRLLQEFGSRHKIVGRGHCRIDNEACAQRDERWSVRFTIGMPARAASPLVP